MMSSPLPLLPWPALRGHSTPHPPPPPSLPPQQEAKREIDEAIETAKAAAVPDAGELWTNIYKGATLSGPAC